MIILLIISPRLNSSFDSVIFSLGLHFLDFGLTLLSNHIIKGVLFFHFKYMLQSTTLVRCIVFFIFSCECTLSSYLLSYMQIKAFKIQESILFKHFFTTFVKILSSLSGQRGDQDPQHVVILLESPFSTPRSLCISND